MAYIRHLRLFMRVVDVVVDLPGAARRGEAKEQQGRYSSNARPAYGRTRHKAHCSLTRVLFSRTMSTPLHADTLVARGTLPPLGIGTETITVFGGGGSATNTSCSR